MSIIIEALPTSLVIGGEDCPIRCDFRTWLKFARETAATDISADKVLDIISLIFYDIPPNFAQMWQAVVNFYNPQEYQSTARAEQAAKRIYDFEYDAKLIYAAFLQQYRIDLTTAGLHWWQFKALFDSLGEDTQFVKVMQYRSVNLSEVKDKKQKEFYRKMQRLYMLPDNRTEEQKQADIDREIAAAFG